MSEYLSQPAVLVFVGMVVSFTAAMLFVSIEGVVRH